MKKKKIILVSALIICFLAGMAGCSKKVSSGNFQENFDLGVKYLKEANYDKAILAFTAVIQIDPKNAEAYKNLAVAYEHTGKPKEAASFLLYAANQNSQPEDIARLSDLIRQITDLPEAATMAQMAYSQTGNPEFISLLFVIKGQEGDFDAISRNIDDMELFDRMKPEYLEDLIQFYIDREDLEGMKQLSLVLNKKETCETAVLSMDMWSAYHEGGHDGVIALLETYYTDEKDMPILKPGEEYYIGGYDANGLRSGYGICFYGPDLKQTSRIYAGNWEKGLRNGTGTAYRSNTYRIQCNWKDDYPEGEVTIFQADKLVYGTLSKGHVATEMNLYYTNGDWYGVHCTPDASKKSGYSFKHYNMDESGTCPCVESHIYCWDCQIKEQEKSDEQGGEE
ncbi:tetratricopeptide repeat protein [Lacrimispora sp. BS-2]|uniref:Tetratricopeptide repeat protein n=1 Tax=Lacrimispora sp. BS-2 TaxID=3151850 RepID=A0AAU7PJA2_9FIRM